MGAFDRQIYFARLLATTLASVVLIAPSVHHRIEFRRGDRPVSSTRANRLRIAGPVVLALGMSGAILLISNILFGTAAAIPVTVAMLGTIAAVWSGMPIRRRVVLGRPRRPEIGRMSPRPKG